MKRLLALAVLMLTFFASIMGAALSHSPYYWLRKGLYFKYRVRASYLGLEIPSLPLILTDTSSMTSYMVKAENLEFSWKIIEVSQGHITVEAVLQVNNAINEKTGEKFNLTFTNRYVVDVDTLDVYLLGESGNRGAWMGEWPYLIHPRLASEKGLKLLFLSNSTLFCQIASKAEYKTLLADAARVNETVYRVSNGTKTYSITTPSGLRIGIGSSAGDYVTYCLGSWTATFTPTNPPPGPETYSLGGTTLGAERIVWNNATTHMWSVKPVSEELKPVFNDLYNTSGRPVLFDHLGNTTLMVDPEGTVYVAVLSPASIMYDSLTGILLRGATYGKPSLIIPLKDMAERITIMPHPTEAQKASDTLFIVELVETNLSFGRPVIGGTQTPSHETFTMRGVGLVMLIIFLLTVIILTLSWRRGAGE